MNNKCYIWVAVDCNGKEYIHKYKPYARIRGIWYSEGSTIQVPQGTIYKLIGRNLRNRDAPVMIKDI